MSSRIKKSYMSCHMTHLSCHHVPMLTRLSCQRLSMLSQLPCHSVTACDGRGSCSNPDLGVLCTPKIALLDQYLHRIKTCRIAGCQKQIVCQFPTAQGLVHTQTGIGSRPALDQDLSTCGLSKADLLSVSPQLRVLLIPKVALIRTCVRSRPVDLQAVKSRFSVSFPTAQGLVRSQN